jgi:hypothetical protein
MCKNLHEKECSKVTKLVDEKVRNINTEKNISWTA